MFDQLRRHAVVEFKRTFTWKPESVEPKATATSTSCDVGGTESMTKLKEFAPRPAVAVLLPLMKAGLLVLNE
ncbi:Uncharacterised protein [uncultured archaeon]|nr:Uncharacterised protein [uncultured archaeon]